MVVSASRGLLVLYVVATSACASRPSSPIVVGVRSPELAGVCARQTTDLDHDGVDDACEAALAEAFAPVIIHSNLEDALPTDVDDLLAQTSLDVFDEACSVGKPPIVVRPRPKQSDLLGQTQTSACGGAPIASDGHRSNRKHHSFFLADVRDEAKIGSWDTRRWTTYVHAYPNDDGGVTLQYWRVYAWNYAFFAHGGDWEGLHVVLDKERNVLRVGLLGHRRIQWLLPSALVWEGAHPVVFSEIGGHTSRATGEGIAARDCIGPEACTVSLADLGTHYRQETWAGGRVVWPDGRVTASGGLINVGEKSTPLNGQAFVRYSGLWGSPARVYATSGYWGPAYNETSMREDGFVTAWCAGMRGPLNVQAECFPASDD